MITDAIEQLPNIELHQAQFPIPVKEIAYIEAGSETYANALVVGQNSEEVIIEPRGFWDESERRFFANEISYRLLAKKDIQSYRTLESFS